MADNHDYVALDWVKGEIEQTLSQARVALEAYVDTPDDTTQLTFCLNYIHQVHGTLQMVEFYGAGLLAEEMEHLCQALIDETVSSKEEALEVLMGAMLQLENYLEHIHSGQKDMAVVLLPTLNDLRASQGRPLLSDTALFTPDLSAATIEVDPANNKRMQDPKVVANLRKLRQMYQISLVGVIRNQDLPENLSYLYKVLARLEKFCHDTPIGKIWWVSVGFLDAIQGQQEGLGSATKHLMRELDHLIKDMIEQSDTILSSPAPLDLLKNLLYYIAKSAATTKRIEDLKAAFNLENALPSEAELDAEREKLQGPDQDTMASVVGVLREELSGIKDQLDLFVRDKNQDQAAFTALVPTLTQIANTLAVLGQGADRASVLKQIELIERFGSGEEQADDQALLDIAGALLQVEANLGAAGRASAQSTEEESGEFAVPIEQFESAHNAVIVESRNGLEQAKNAIVGFIASQWDHHEIEGVPDLLDSIRGGLQIIPLNRAADLLDACSRFIRTKVLESQAVPEWEQLDRLADAITSIEYYMERMSAGASDNEKILNVAEESLGKLGMIEGKEVDQTPIMSEHHTSEVASESPDAMVKGSDESLIDEDILEIFIEEVDEVMAAIQVAMQVVRQDPENMEQIAELRRAFHTLKGSGRLVGAADIGETAWSIENLLNKYIEQNHALAPEDFALLDMAQGRLPALVEDFSKQESSAEFQDIIDFAERLFSDLQGGTLAAGTDTPSEQAAEPAEENSQAEASDQEPVVEAEATPEPEPEDDLIDDEILEIFIEEAEEVSETIATHLPAFLNDYEDQEALTELRRAYHTLKGSGRMVEASDIGETAWGIENMLNRVIDGSVNMSQDISDVVKYVSGIIPELVDDFRNRRSPEYDVLKIQAHCESLANGEVVPAISTLSLKSADAGSGDTEAADSAPVDGVDEALLEIFESEVAGHVQTVEDFVARAKESGEPVDIEDGLSRALHTLKGSAKTANIDCIAEVAIPTEKFIKEARARLIQVDDAIADLLAEMVLLIKEGLTHLVDEPKTSLSGSADYLNRLQEISSRVLEDLAEQDDLEGEAGQDPQLVNIFLTEGLDILLDAEKLLDDWEGNPVSSESLDQLFGEVKTLHRGAKIAGLDSIAELCAAIEHCYDCIATSQVPEGAFLSDIKRAHEVLIDMMDQVAAGLSAVPDQPLLERLLAYQPSEVADTDEDLNDKLDELDKELDEVIPEYQPQVDEEGAEREGSAETAQTSESQAEDDDFDQELIEIFLEEATDIISGLSEAFEQMQTQDENSALLQRLERDFHTLKGGARMASIESMGDLAHSLEGLFGEFTLGQSVVTDGLWPILDSVKTTLNASLTALSGNDVLPEVSDLILQIKNYEPAGQEPEPEELTLADAEEVAEAVEAPEMDVLPEESETLEVEETINAPSQAGALADLDPELVEIFMEEARDIIANTGQLLHQWEGDVANIDVVAELQRELHTLKGGARMAEIAEIGDLSHELETLFERIVENRFETNPNMVHMCLRCHDALTGMVEAVGAGETLADSSELLSEIKQLVEGTSTSESVEPSQEEIAAAVETTPVPEPVVESVSELDDELVEIFMEEARDIIDNTGNLLNQWENDTQNLDLVAELQRELHTLKGGARMAEISAIGDLAHELETLFERIVENRFGVQPGMIQLCLACHDALAGMVDSVASGQAIPDASELLAQVKGVVETGESGASSLEAGEESEAIEVEEPAVDDTASVSPDDLESDLLPIFLDESKDILISVSEYLDQWSEDESSTNYALELQREMHTLKGGARLADIDAIADLAEAGERRLEQYVSTEQGNAKDIIQILQETLHCLNEMLEKILSGEDVAPREDLVNKIAKSGLVPAEEKETSSAQEEDHDLDPEVLALFVEEARELADTFEAQLAAWSDNPENEDHNREIQRVLHTLKGGARLSNLNPLADASHELETVLVEALDKNKAFKGAFKKKVMAQHDQLLALVDQIQKEHSPSEAESTKVEKKAEAPAKPAAKKTKKKAVEQPAQKKAAPKAAPPAKAKPDQTKAVPQETIRVSSGVIEELINLAGETSISRGRLETQISDFGFTLEEMAATIERLREQLRRMEMETEAQVLFRAEKEGFSAQDYTDFDPLEMDRYSSIQQLSRSLSESATDLTELREALSDKSRGAETLLLQQSRINSELQENLMKTRMIPFSSMVPRLRRIARQISGELNKQVNFDVSNAEGEMDRSILERMIAPLEHMLRNALDHGIESTTDRKKAGKPEMGNVRLSLSREGGDVVIRMRDDGAGINDKRVFDKAVSQGLVKADSKASRHDILQFIMLPGFSTAEQVTQISGRGVGMDVVASEIKQMGGSIEIDSTFGQGTEFTVRLPFTVSVNRALMVNTGEDFYAIPLNTIEGIVRVSPFELEEYYKPDAPLYEYAGRKYKLQYLGKLLHSSHQPKLQGQPLPLPVILVRGADKPMALQVDSLMGSREIVVKSLGPQFGGVHAVSGATILGDGSVVVILDLPALIRDESAGKLDLAEDVGVHVEKDADTPLVMVIDDSVTVRKVTTRLLERNGMEVVTAKDGVDAIAQLQDIKPDVMLLDIEMPRMDGFEVATLVRHDERLKDVPIIMITSRTGQKHRERALAIGVNEYLGKPFQEQELLETIEKMTVIS